MVNNESSSQDRKDLYTEGGCFMITSRILIVDFLDGKVNPADVSGLLIYNAHKFVIFILHFLLEQF